MDDALAGVAPHIRHLSLFFSDFLRFSSYYEYPAVLYAYIPPASISAINARTVSSV